MVSETDFKVRSVMPYFVREKDHPQVSKPLGLRPDITELLRNWKLVKYGVKTIALFPVVLDEKNQIR